MTACVRILSTSSVDSSPAILLVAPDGSKILVNCGEGCQRCFLEYGQRLSTVSTICLTHLGHEAVGGLPGAILTTADGAAAADAHAIVQKRGVQRQQHPAKQNGPKSTTTPAVSAAADAPQLTLPGLEVLGPVGTNQFMGSLRHFMRREKFQVVVHEGAVEGRQPTKQLSGRKRGAHKRKKEDAASEPFAFTIQSLAYSEDVSSTSSPTHNHSRKRPHSVDASLNGQGRQVLSFIIKTPLIPGKFLRDKAIELGVPKGPLYGKLKSGQSVTFVDGAGNEQTVESCQVVTPSSPAVAVMILYYPSVAVARQMFITSDKLKVEAESKDVCLELVVHIAPQDLLVEYGLPFWKERNKVYVEHILLSTDRKAGDLDGTPFRSAGQGAKARALLCPQIYQVPRPPYNPQSASSDVRGYKVGRATMEYTLIPRSKRGFSDRLDVFNGESDDQEAAKLVETTGALATARKGLTDCAIADENEATGELMFTGTGSAMPCKHRNVTGMLLKQADGRSILLDVGEGTIGQLLRAQPADENNDILASIKAVWISHPHADHHLGLLRLLKDRVSSEPVLLLAPTPIFRFLEEYSVIDPSIGEAYYAIDCKDLVDNSKELCIRLQKAVGISNCRAFPVAHCPHSYAVILDGTSFGRVVYSGDCRPSSQLAQVAKGADLLIHEASFEDGMEAEAALKKHSTVGEALRVGYEMESKCTILTHFSQRYPKISPTPAGDYSFSIIFAFDYMRVQQRTLAAASNLTPALRLLFPEGGEDDDGTTPVYSTAVEAMSIPGVFAMSNFL
jgi:ribonuclease Z